MSNGIIFAIGFAIGAVFTVFTTSLFAANSVKRDERDKAGKCGVNEDGR